MRPVGLTTAFEIAGAAGVVLAALTFAAGAARIGSRLALDILAATVSKWSGARKALAESRPEFAGLLARIEADVTVAGISSDRLYPLRLQYEIAELLPKSTTVEVVDSDVGHDGFLVEQDAIGKIVRRALTG